MRIGILGASKIAFRRFLPALMQISKAEYAGVASRDREKACFFSSTFGGAVYDSYDDLLNDTTVELVYIPLPPALHYEWGMKALKAGKHILIEKPFTDSIKHTKALMSVAEANDLCAHENYMFLYHQQLQRIKELIDQGDLGELRSLSMSFGFPQRSADDFRYRKDLGGGALLDCGGYPVRLALELMGSTTRVMYSQLGYADGFDVDMFGNVLLENEDGLCAYVSFGMDNAYRCSLEVWGSKMTLTADRVFTADPAYSPTLTLKASSGDEQKEVLSPDDHFRNSIEHMIQMINRKDHSDNEKIIKQAELTDMIRKRDYYHTI